MDDPLKNFISSGNLRLDSQLKFTAEIDKMTSVLRRTLLIDRSRRENDAEHSWHISVMALLFAEYTKEKVNVMHTVEMMLVHDLVEIYAGDTFAYDTTGYATKAKRENEAADRLFAMLPADQSSYIRNLWMEFDECQTDDAKYANCLDRLQPLFHNMLTEGHTWRNSDYPTDSIKVRKRMAIVKEFMPDLYCWVDKNITHAIKVKWLKEQ